MVPVGVGCQHSANCGGASDCISSPHGHGPSIASYPAPTNSPAVRARAAFSADNVVVVRPLRWLKPYGYGKEEEFDDSKRSGEEFEGARRLGEKV